MGINSTARDGAIIAGMIDTIASTACQPSATELRALVDLAPDGIFVADVEGRYTFVNEAGCRMLGRPPGEIVGKSIVDVIRPAEVERLAAVRDRLLLGESHVGEWTLRRGDGTWIPVEVNARILADGQWLGFVRDISDRKADEAERDAALEAAESDRRWLNTVLETMPFGVLLFQPDGRLYFNRRTEEILGMKLSPTGGSAQYADRILFPDGRPVPPGELLTSQVLREGKPVIAAEFRVRRPDGTQVPVLSSAAPIRDTGGRVIGGVGAFQDVTERMRMEQAIRASERLLRGIFEILPVGVWIADATGRIVSNNPAGERIWRGARYVPIAEFDQYKGWWADTGKPIAAEEWALARAIRKGETSDAELIRIQCFDGSFKTIINTAAPLRDDEGAITGAIVVNEDITALQQAQEQLRAAVRDREEILAVVTHDLRNPLGGLTMAAAALERKLRDLPGGEPLRAVAATLVDIARRMSGMVDDLLAVTVASSGGPSMLKLEPVASASLLERAAQAARPLLAKESLELQVRAAGELPAIHADADRVLRVFANLLDNALKFTSPRGRITLSAERTAGGVRFCVANSGPPLAAAQRESMFQPFWQAAHDRRGAGLGLSICRSIVEAHGGSIWAEPAADQRVRVCFVLPLQAGVRA